MVEQGPDTQGQQNVMVEQVPDKNGQQGEMAANDEIDVKSMTLKRKVAHLLKVLVSNDFFNKNNTSLTLNSFVTTATSRRTKQKLWKK
jgi:hypothetical protein